MPKSKLQKSKDNPRSKYWKNRADKLWGLVIHDIYQVCAVNMDCAGRVEAHHLISRANTATRHAVENGIGLCSKHHKFDSHLSAHKAIMGFAEWLAENSPGKVDWFSKDTGKISKPVS